VWWFVYRFESGPIFAKTKKVFLGFWTSFLFVCVLLLSMGALSAS